MDDDTVNYSLAACRVPAPRNPRTWDELGYSSSPSARLPFLVVSSRSLVQWRKNITIKKEEKEKILMPIVSPPYCIIDDALREKEGERGRITPFFH